MLTLQDILGSDSFSTAIQKINENFKSIAIAGGGPQGIRGEQGIPGLPGKQGSTGPQGPAGVNGLSVDILPFGVTNGTFTGPTAGPAVGQVTWPVDSLIWLQQNYGDPTANPGITPTPGMVVIDHANFGYWQYQDGIQALPIPPLGPLDPGAQDGDAAYQQGYYTGASWTGPGWYYYQSDLGNLLNSATDVWVNDYTTYLTGPVDYNYQLNTNTFNAPYSVPRARLKTKFGTIWVSSHNSTVGTDPSGNNDSSIIKDINLGGYSERSAGVDRLMFKMSLDGRPVSEHVAIQSYTGPLPSPADIPNTTYIPVNTPWEASYISPLYNKSLLNYSALLYLAPWSEGDESTTSGDETSGVAKGNLGIFAYQEQESDNPGPLQLWVLTHRKQGLPKNNIAFPGEYPSSLNYGVHLIDSRRTITSNQYAVLPSQDTAPIDEETRVTTASPSLLTSAYLNNESGPYVYQGYHSLINGSFVNNSEYTKTYWLNGTETTVPGPWVSSSADLSHNKLSYPLNFVSGEIKNVALYKRASWFGSSVHSQDPSDTDSLSSVNEYIRSAGMLERDRAYTFNYVETPGFDIKTRANELLFYTAYNAPDSNTNPYTSTGLEGNMLNSKVALYLSPSRNVGIGTVPVRDIGIVEPHGRLQVHVKRSFQNERSVNGTVLTNGTTQTTQYSLIGTFSADGAINTDNISNYAVVKIGRAKAPQYQSELDIFTDYTTIPQGGIRFETYKVAQSSRLRNTGSLQFGIGLGRSNSLYEINSVAANFGNEWMLALSPIANGANGVDTDDHSNRGLYVAGVGIQERFPRTRFHMYGHNSYFAMGETGPNDPEGLYGRATYSATGPVPAGNTSAHRQIAIDYVENKWIVSAGILDYAYDSTNNKINYPYTEGFLPKITYGIVSETPDNKFTTTVGPATSNDGHRKTNALWFPTGTTQTAVSTTTHGGALHAQFPITHYQGFNLIRDLSYFGDDKDLTRWKTGTDGTSNGAVGFVTDSFGDIGLVNIPRWRDGGTGAGRYEQRNIGQRDVLNNMKIFFSAEGNVGIGSKPGIDRDAYPSIYKNVGTTGDVNKVYYFNLAVGSGLYPATVYYTGPGTPRIASSPSTVTPPLWGGQPVGRTFYPAPLNIAYGTAWANSTTTLTETIRFEIAASKLFEAPGRILQNRGWGYPANRTTAANYLDLKFTVWKSSNEAGSKFSGTCKASTDGEGRITKLFFNNVTTIITELGGGTNQTVDRILLQHPTEITGYTAPIGAIAPGITSITFTNAPAVTIIWDEKVLAPANLRINNFVAGEGQSTIGTTGPTPSGYTPSTNASEDSTGAKALALRRESPKIILTYEGIDPERGESTPIKVNTIIRSAQNVSSYREFWIPKSDNAGATLMAFTSHFETGANNDSIDRKSIKKERLALEEVTYVAIDYDYGGKDFISNAANKSLLRNDTATVSIDRNRTNGSGSTPPTETTLSIDTSVSDTFAGAITYNTTTDTFTVVTAGQYTIKANATGNFRASYNCDVDGGAGVNDNIDWINSFKWGAFKLYKGSTVVSTVTMGNSGQNLNYGYVNGFSVGENDGAGPNPIYNGSNNLNNVNGANFSPSITYTSTFTAGETFKIVWESCDASIAGGGANGTGGPFKTTDFGNNDPTFSKVWTNWRVTNRSVEVIAAGASASIVGMFHPTYVKYDYNLNNVGTESTLTTSPDAIGWPSAWGVTTDSVFFNKGVSYSQYYDASSGIKNVLHPLRAVIDRSGVAKGYRHAVEVVKTGTQESRTAPTQIRFRRINSDWAMMDYNITLKVNDAFDLALNNIEEPIPPIPVLEPGDDQQEGNFAYNIQRRGLWWLQHVKIRFDIDSGMVLGSPSVTATNTPDYHGTAYDKGMGFRMWSDYNQWYNGNAVAHPGVQDYVRYKTNAFGRTYPQNSWNWNPYIGDLLNGNSRINSAPEVTVNQNLVDTTSRRWLVDPYASAITFSTSSTAIDCRPYDRVFYIPQDQTAAFNSVENILVEVETGYNTGSYTTLVSYVEVNTMGSPINWEVPADCRYKISVAKHSGDFKLNIYRRGSSFPLSYHKLVKNTGFDWGLSSNTGVLLPFAQALRNRAFYNGTWNDIYDEGDGYDGQSSRNLENFMRQVWGTFGNNAFMKTKVTQWRVTPYNDPGTRGGQYEQSNFTGSPSNLPTINGVPITNDIIQPGPYQGGQENSFYLEVIIPDAILHDPVGGFGTWESGANKGSPARVQDGFTEARAYRYVTLSGQAMVNFQEVVKNTAYFEVNPNLPADPVDTITFITDVGDDAVFNDDVAG
jgi:hypothetical protein